MITRNQTVMYKFLSLDMNILYNATLGKNSYREKTEI